MAPNILHLPNGATITVTSVYGGLYFKSNDLNSLQSSQMPPGWTIVLHSEDDDAPDDDDNGDEEDERSRQTHTHRYRKPTLHNDTLFISAISIPSSNDFKAAASPTRQMALMLWATLWWYFHQPRPDPQLDTPASSKTPQAGKPKGDWRIRIKRQGAFKGRYILPKLERMGLIASEESCVGDGDDKNGDGWRNMFVSQRSFWQIDARIFLFTLPPSGNSPFPPGSPFNSRPSSPNRDSGVASPRQPEERPGQGLWSPASPGPFASTSHLPTYYPPPPPQYTFTKGIRHPIRPKPPRQGETFYTRYVPSVGQYLSFRVASLSKKSVVHSGPVGVQPLPSFLPPGSAITPSSMARALNNGMSPEPSDAELLQAWMNDPRVEAFWGAGGPAAAQEDFLRAGLNSRHSFPAIGCWDGKPFGYFEIYWVKEDVLGPHVGGEAGGAADWDRGVHALVGEQEFRGKYRVKLWLSALVHYCWLADYRTTRVLCEPRVDNEKFINYLQEVGFSKEKEVALPHKQSFLMKISREAWDSPFL